MNDTQPFIPPQDDDFAPPPQSGQSGGKSTLLVGVGVILLAALGFVAYTQIEAAKDEGARQQSIDQVRREYLERATLALTMVDPGRYEEERRALFKWYLNALTTHYNKYPEHLDYARFEKELSRMGGDKAAPYEKRYQIIKSFWEMISAGKYIPVFTAHDQGLRFDIYRMETTTLDGEPAVRLHFALYGVQRQWTEEQSNSGRLLRMRVNARYEEFRVDGRDEAGKPKLEMSLGSGEPFNINHPERFIEEFPPAMVVGYYEIPRIPEVAALEMNFQIGTRSVVSGQEVLGNFVWKMAEMPDELKLPAGREWKDAERRIIESDE